MHIRRDNLARAFERRLHQPAQTQIEITSERKAWITGIVQDNGHYRAKRVKSGKRVVRRIRF